MVQRLEVLISTGQNGEFGEVNLKGDYGVLFSGADLAWIAASVIVAAVRLSGTDASVYTDTVIPKLVDRLMVKE